MEIIVNLANIIGEERDFPLSQRVVVSKNIFISIGYQNKAIMNFGTSFALFNTGGWESGFLAEDHEF